MITLQVIGFILLIWACFYEKKKFGDLDVMSRLPNVRSAYLCLGSMCYTLLAIYYIIKYLP